MVQQNLRMKALPAAILFFVLAAIAVPQIYAGDDWIKVRSANFQLAGNASEKNIRNIAVKLEQFRAVFGDLFPQMNVASPTPTTVIVFKDDRSFSPYKPLTHNGKTAHWVAGYFQPGDNINYITITTERDQDETFRTIFHEYVHFLVNNTFGRSKVPPWLNEGLAEYYEQFSIQRGRRAVLGAANNEALRILSSNNLIPLDDLFSTDYDKLHGNEDHGVSIFYAQSWALMHYMMRGKQGQGNEQVAEFLDLLAKDTGTAEAFKQVFKIEYAVLETNLRTYISQGNFTASSIPLKEMPVISGDLQTGQMTTAEVKATLGDLLSHSNRTAEAEAHLKEALALDPRSIRANTALGFLKMRQANYDEAAHYLEKASAIAPGDHLLHFRYAYCLGRQFVGANNIVSVYPDDIAARMRAALQKSIAIEPGFAESYGLLAMISLVRNERIEEGIVNLNKAIALAPSNQQYRLNLASLYMNVQDYDRARPLIDSVRRSAAEPAVKDHAQRLFENLIYMEGRLAVEKQQGNGGNSKVLITPDGKPPTEEEIAKVRSEAEFEAISAALRIPKIGETRLAAHLSGIDCNDGKIVYTARSGKEHIRFFSNDFQKLYLRKLEPAAAKSIGCGTVKDEFYAILTYIPSGDIKALLKGELVSIEIVPERFDFLGQRK